MKYVGSKNKLAKHLAPIIQSYVDKGCKGYLEPFVGGANMIDKIKHHNKIGCDIHEELIELLKYVQIEENILPKSITKNEYENVKTNPFNYPKWYVGLVGFCATYNSKYFGGYAGQCVTKQGIRHYDKEAIRNIEKQRLDLTDINFVNCDFLSIDPNKTCDYVIYCDIPYKNTTKYKTQDFPYSSFYKWCKDMSRNNIVLVSEYSMPEEFKCIWEKETKTTLDKNNNIKRRVEKLFVVNEL